MDKGQRLREIEGRLKALDLEKEKLLKELDSLTPAKQNICPPLLGTPASDKTPTLPNEKVDLFLKLFGCRKDVYPRLWENTAKRTKGYSPVCRKEWVAGVCKKPQVKCMDCSHRAFLPLEAKVIRDHLTGKETIGTYTIRQDDTCTFLAADFDGPSWKQDVAEYQKAARELGVNMAVERSRSGNGGHAWLFFSEPVPAWMARQLGTAIMARTSSQRLNLGLQSYDRFFPNQDTMPKGGFGNLIALPLQKNSRNLGNSVFVDETFEPYADQWEFLAKQKMLSLKDLGLALEKAIPSEDFLPLALIEDTERQRAEKAMDAGSMKLSPGCFHGKITMCLGEMLTIFLNGLPPPLIFAFKRTATFANPKFFELQRLRFSTWKTPRYIFCGEMFPDRILLPRGTLEACTKLCEIAGAQMIFEDTRNKPGKLKISFEGKLAGGQKKATAEMLKHKTGVLVAPPGAGKTVMACKIIAGRKTPTLILVHRKQLLEQWREQLSTFLGMDPKKIGVLDRNGKKVTGEVDLAMLQTLSKLEDLREAFAKYGHIIIDECHHVPAFSFESVLKQIPAKYFLGLTATPYRKDGHQAILHMQCGPVRYEMKDSRSAELKKRVVVHETNFAMPSDTPPQPPIHEVWEMLVADEERLHLVARDVKQTLEAGRLPLILSDRKEHLALLSEAIKNMVDDLPVREFVLVGNMGKKAMNKVLTEMQDALQSSGRLYILATGSLIGEGFDLPALDTLILAMPVSFKGRLIQYAGRIHRKYPGKSEVLIHDYLDASSGLTVSMFKKRLAAYKQMNYQIETPDGDKGRGEKGLFG